LVVQCQLRRIRYSITIISIVHPGQTPRSSQVNPNLLLEPNDHSLARLIRSIWTNVCNKAHDRTLLVQAIPAMLVVRILLTLKTPWTRELWAIVERTEHIVSVVSRIWYDSLRTLSNMEEFWSMHSLELFLWVRCLVSAGFALARVVIEIFAPNNDCKNAGWMLRIALKFFWYSHRRIIEPSFVLPLYFMWRDLSLTALTTISLRERQTLNYRLTLIIFFKLRSRLASLL